MVGFIIALLGLVVTPSARAVAQTGSDAWQAFTVRTTDGVETPALVRQPTGQGRSPVVIFFHGAPGGQGVEALRRIATEGAGPIRWERLLKEGFAVCIADYRGHPPNKPFEVLQGAVNAVDDARAIINHLKGFPFVDPERVGLIGGSLGGAIVLETSRREKLKATVLNAPATFPFLGYRGQPLQPECSQAVPDSAIDKTGALDRIASISKVGGVDCQVTYAGGLESFVGLDQVNVRLPRSLIGRGEVDVLLAVDGQAANIVKVNVK